MAKKQPVWALDIGQAALKALKLMPGKTPDQVHAEAFDFIEYPKILSQPDADPDELVREALETFLERNDLKGCKVVIGVPGQSGLVKFIKLPPVEKKRIPDIVKFEARQQIPFALEEVVWAYQQIGDHEEADEDFTMAEVGLFAMKRDQIHRAITPFQAVGIEVDIVQMGPIALYNFITFDQIKAPPARPAEGTEIEDEPPKGERKGSLVLIDIGADNTDLIITDGTRIWQRNVPIGGNHFTRALTKELKLTFAKAEHLKRNATKAPDPRSIFTAMRGVFNDFTSEINRSIGFYSSVNRHAKIAKVIGLGNGFKLPGLQKFLQQNLSHEVEKLESFARIEGENVTPAPQFQENLPSFAVAYGLGIQGLGFGELTTNLLPPEIAQVRLIRAKKPWALAASALLMLGVSGLFLGDYRVLAKVDTPRFQTAVDQARQVAATGSRYKSEFDAAKNEWRAKYDEGRSLVGDAAERARWPEFLKTINAHIFDPVQPYHLDPNKPADQWKLDRLRVHIDAIKPVWRNDLAADWFNSPALIDSAKNLMHPYDRANPPSGEGWIVQIVGHHYNPYPDADDARKRLDDPTRTMFGPYGFLVNKILPNLMTPELRLYGVDHVALAWMTTDKAWTTEKASATNGLAGNTVPILDRATPPAPSSSGGTAPYPGGAVAPHASGRAETPYPGGNPYPGGMPYPGSVPPPGGMSGMAGPADLTKRITMLTRTDFLIQFIWQPPKPEDQPKDAKARMEKRDEIAKLLLEAEKNSSVVTSRRESDIEAALEATSLKQSEELNKAMSKGIPPAGPVGVQATPGGMPAAGGMPTAPGGPAPAPPAAIGMPTPK